jgi:large subunit ribosomal protein L9
MEVILLERIEKLGQMGDVVSVKPGFARNYLLPQKKALRATKDNMSLFEAQRAQLEADNLSRKQEAEAVAGKMEGAAIIVIRQAGDAGHLYGSVSARDISDGLTEAGFTVDRRQVTIDRPIKDIGLHDVRLVLHPEVSVTVSVNVARSEEEAKVQSERAARGEEAVLTPSEMAAEQEAMEDEAVEEALEAAPAPDAELFEEGAAPAEEPEREEPAAESAPEAADAEAGEAASKETEAESGEETGETRPE